MLIEFLSYGFVQRGLIAGSFVAIICAIIGTFLVLKKLSLIGDGMSHVCLTGVAVAMCLSANPIYVSIPIVVLASLGIQKIIQKFRIYGDAAIGIVSAFGLAIALLITALSNGFNTDLLGYLFGSILTVTLQEVIACSLLLVVVICCLWILYPLLLATCFDEAFARTRGISTNTINTGLIVVTAVTVVLSFKVVGIFLISAMLIVPPVSALMVARTFRQVLLYACAFSLISVWSGVFVSYCFNIPSGAMIILCNLCFLIGSYFIKKFVRKC